MPLHNLTRFPRLEFIGAPTPLEYLPHMVRLDRPGSNQRIGTFAQSICCEKFQLT